jgi:nitroreductase
MHESIETLITSRVSTGHYDATKTIDRATIEELVRLATYAPSAFNLQNWRFIAVHSTEAKRKLYDQAYGQNQVLEASVTFIICGRLSAYKTLHETLQLSVDAEIIPESLQQEWVEMAHQSHADNPQQQRDEAIRSASLAAMTLMLAAQGKNLVTGAMGGFDPAGVAREFNLEKDELPILLVTAGFPTASIRKQKIRQPVNDVLSMC